MRGQTFALPTKDARLRVLELREIQVYVDLFYMFAAHRKDLVFLVTEVGCGLAGYRVDQIARLFIGSVIAGKQSVLPWRDNVRLPARFLRYAGIEFIPYEKSIDSET